MIDAVDNSKSPAVNVLQEIKWITRAWTKVSSETNFNCLPHSGFERNFETDWKQDNEYLACLKSRKNAATADGCDISGDLNAETFSNFDDLIV